MTQRQACVSVGISEATFYKWKSICPDIEHLLNAARERARKAALAVIKTAGEQGDWRAAEAFLKLAFKQDYNPRQEQGTKTSVTINQAVLVDETQRQKLIEQRQRLLSTTPATAPQRRLTSAESVQPEQLNGERSEDALSSEIDGEILKDETPTE